MIKHFRISKVYAQNEEYVQLRKECILDKVFFEYRTMCDIRVTYSNVIWLQLLHLDEIEF